MFKTLSGMATCVAALTVSITAAEGKLTVIVLPKPKTAGEGLQTPFVLTGTPEEIDEKFYEEAAKYVGKYRTLAEQNESTCAVLDAATKASAARAVDGLKKAAAPAPTKGATNVGSGSGERASEGEADGDQIPVAAAAVANAEAPATVANLFT